MIESIKARLDEIQDSPIDNVGFALNLATAMKKAPTRGVECFVVPVGDKPGSNMRTAGPALQEVDVTIGIVIAIRALNDRSGERSHDTLEEVRQVIRDKLFGWIPEGATTHFLLGKGDLISMQPGTVWYLDRYLTKTHYQQKGN